MLKQVCALAMAVFIFTACSNNNEKKSNNQMTEDIFNANNEIYMLVGTYTSGESKGIYVYKLDTVLGTSGYINEVQIANPSYLTLSSSEEYIYAVSEEEGETASVSAFTFNKQDGSLNLINRQLTGGGAPCYITIDDKGKHLVIANYLGGSVTSFMTNDDGGINEKRQILSFEGNGPDKERQDQPHLHCVMFSPDGNYIFANDLGSDKIYKLDVNNTNSNDYLTMDKPESFSVKSGSGPRHIAFHPNGRFAYLITELLGDVIVFDYNNGSLFEKQVIKADTLNARGSADIHVSPDGKFLYASNRLEGDGIVIFKIHQDDGTLTKIGYQETGLHPRNFAITPNGKLLVVANKDSGIIQVFKRNMESGLLENTQHDIKLDMPVCIKFASIK